MARVAIVAKAEKAGALPLYLRVHAEGKDRYVSLGMKVKPKDWNADRAEVRRSHPQAVPMNRTLTTVRGGAERILANARADAQAEGRGVRLRDVLPALRRLARPETATPEAKGRGGAFAFMEARIRDRAAEGKIASARKYKVVLKKLRAFAGAADIDFDRIDVAFVRDFEHYLKAECGNGINTTEKNLATLRAVLREAISRGRMKQGDYPFFGVQLRRKKVTKPTLTTDEIDALAAVDPGADEWARWARDLWLFAFYAGGMRFGDVARLRWEDVRGGRLRYSMGKTGEVQSLVLIPPAAAVLDAYRHREGGHERVFPILDGYDMEDPAEAFRAINNRNVYTNTALRRLAKRAGIERKVTFHLARHSLARYLLDKGVGVYQIKEILRHSSVKVTEGYLSSLEGERLDAAYSSAFSSPSDPSAEASG